MKQKPFIRVGLGLLMFTLPLLTNAETIILHSGATLTAPVLADRPSGVVLDLGFTVLMIPKDKILSLESEIASLILTPRTRMKASRQALTAIPFTEQQI